MLITTGVGLGKEKTLKGLIVPVGADLQPVGPTFSVPSGDAFVTEGRLTALADGRLVASANPHNGEEGARDQRAHVYRAT